MKRKVKERDLTPFLFAVLVVAGCAGGADEPLGPREVFRWSDQPVAFSPPPGGWAREGELSGGVKGVRFVKERGQGEAITVGEFHRIAERDRTAAIRKIIDEFDSLDRRDFLEAVSLARARTDNVFTNAEASMANDVNQALSRAQRAYFDGDANATRWELDRALEAAGRFELSLDDVLESAVIEPMRAQHRSRFESIQQEAVKLGSHDAVRFDWTFDHNGRTYHRREIYLVYDSHLFTIRFVGLAETLPLFDRVASSIEFPTP